MNLKELLRVIEDIKKDLDYTRRLEERWASEQKRFPLIYKYIIKQREFFQQQIDGAMNLNVDETQLNEYVANRPGVKVQKLKTAQVAPPREELAPESPPAELPKTEKRVVEETPLEDKMPDSDEETKDAAKALEEAAAEAARKLRDGAPEPVTQPVSKIPKEKLEAAETEVKKPTETAGEEAKPSTRDKLRKLASEVLNEVKRSKTD
jgi:hypothetical protein